MEGSERPYATSDANRVGEGRGVEHEVGRVRFIEVLHPNGELLRSQLKDILLQSGWEAPREST